MEMCSGLYSSQGAPFVETKCSSVCCMAQEEINLWMPWRSASRHVMESGRKLLNKSQPNNIIS
eukprot:1555017-Karenia_brevis.AAC.1